ncbi:hypothetical protein [Asanoa hainanensis]|uniref:hypothetical protein n=1 Tax=Asanoa hainanensis TaxID=560556 RepID=UPI000B7984A2|nr:hypothetical protein [Asanoa hainanensis]
MLAGIRLYVVADGDRSTLRLFATTANIPAILFGTYLSLTPVLLFGVGFGLWVYWLKARRDGAAAPPWATPLVSGAMIILAVFISPPLLLATFVLIVGFFYFGNFLMVLLEPISGPSVSDEVRDRERRRWKERIAEAERRGWSKTRRVAYALRPDMAAPLEQPMVRLFPVIFLGMLLVIPSPWLPAERMQLRGAAPQTVFVVQREEDYLTVLVKETGESTTIRRDSIVAERLCDDSPDKPTWVTDFTIIALMNEQRPRTPRCQDLH